MKDDEESQGGVTTTPLNPGILPPAKVLYSGQVSEGKRAGSFTQDDTL